MIQAPPRTILEVFESLPEGTLCQLINNQLVMLPAPTSRHQDVLLDIAFELKAILKSNNLGKVFIYPIDVYFDPENVYQPDILFVSKERLHIVNDKIKGTPDLIIEVLSPGSEKIDKTTKKKNYERFGVKEYWIVDPTTKIVIGYQLAGNKFVDIPSENGIIQSRLLNITIQF